MLDKAIRIAAQVFEGVSDKQGKPYILHCLQVMNDCGSNDEDVLCAAVLHDVLEDFEEEWPVERLRFEGMSMETLKLVSILTKSPDEDYSEYIANIGNFPDAIKIKLADLRHNSDITRLKDIRPKDIARMEKYHKAYKYLTECLKQHSQA